MMGILDLPSEIAEQILAYDALEWLDKYAFARTCRGLYNLAFASLYRDVDLSLQADGQNSRSFINLCNAEQRVARLVHSMTLRVSPPSEECEAESQQARHILSILHNLRTLAIDDHLVRKDCIPNLLSLQTIDLLHPGRPRNCVLQWGDIRPLFALRSVRQVSLPYRLLPLDPPPSDDKDEKHSNVESLEIKGLASHLAGIEHVLGWTRNLNNLSLEMGINSDIDSETRLSDYLAPVRDTLQSLKLTHWVGNKTLEDLYELHEGSSLDLSEFPLLKHADCPAYLFFGVQNGPDLFEQRQGLYERLPSSLETLRVDFSHREYPFMSETLDKYGESLNSEVNWLVDISNSKAEFLPKLRLIGVTESSFSTRPLRKLHGLEEALRPVMDVDIEIEVYDDYDWLQSDECSQADLAIKRFIESRNPVSSPVGITL